MTKSELRSMIRAMLHEELHKVKCTGLLHEGAEEILTTGMALKAFEKMIELRRERLETSEPSDPFEDIFGDGSTYSDPVPDFDKILELANVIYKSPKFKFNTRADIDRLDKEKANMVMHRTVSDAITNANGDKQKFLAWVDSKSNFSTADKKMFHDILD